MESKLPTNPEEAAEELWDEFSQYIDDNSDSFLSVAGSSIISQSDFKNAILKFAFDLGRGSREWVSVETETPSPYTPVNIYNHYTHQFALAWRASDGERDMYTIFGTDIIWLNITHWCYADNWCPPTNPDSPNK